MSRRVYISADYSISDGDRDVIKILHSWGRDNLHKIDYVDTAQVVSGSVSDDPDCRACDLKAEFNRQINASSTVIFVIGDKTKDRTAGSSCRRMSAETICQCTPYKQNANGASYCKCPVVYDADPNGDLGNINDYSYLKHELLQAKRRGKNIIIVYNSLYKWSDWLPSYMRDYEDQAQPFWIKNSWGEKVGNYDFIKKALGYD